MAKKKPAKRRTNRTHKTTVPDWAPAFLNHLRGTANISGACVAAGVGRQTAYDRRNSDEAFALAMADAIEGAVDDLEEEARRRAMTDSDSLMSLLLKAHRPEKYRESVKHDVSVKGNVTVVGGIDLDAVVGRKPGLHRECPA